MKKILVLTMALSSILFTTQAASAATKVTVVHQYSISKNPYVVTFHVKGLPKDHGIYITQCMAPDKGKRPTKCDPSPKTKIWISNVKADQSMGAKSGGSKLTMSVDPYFSGGDCIHTTCVFFVTNDHNASNDRTEDQAIPFKFE